jgi:DNA-binding FrmR family transcriptional regulator
VDAASKQSIDRRLARIEGQIRGLRRMVQADEYCCDILTQLAATRSALDQTGVEMAASHVKTCIVGHGTEEAHAHAKPMSQDEMMEELKVTLSRLMR